MPKLELSLLQWLMTNLSLLEFFQQQGSFYSGGQPNQIPLLRKNNVELQILISYKLWNWKFKQNES